MQYPEMLDDKKQLFADAVWPVWIADAESLKVLWVNEATRTTLGVEPSGLIDRFLLEILSPRSPETDIDTYKKTIISGVAFNAYFDPYATIPVAHEDIVYTNRCYVKSSLHHNYLVLFVRPGKSPLLNQMLTGSDRFIMRLDKDHCIEEILPTSYWSELIPDRKIFKKQITDIVVSSDWNAYCKKRALLRKLALQYADGDGRIFGESLYDHIPKTEIENNVPLQLKKIPSYAEDDYQILCEVEVVSGNGFAILFGQNVPYQNKGFHFGLTKSSQTFMWALKVNSVFVSASRCDHRDGTVYNIAITKCGNVLRISVNGVYVSEYVAEDSSLFPNSGTFLLSRGKNSFRKVIVKTRKNLFARPENNDKPDAVRLRHLPGRYFEIEPIYVELWDSGGMPAIDEAYIVKDVTRLKIVEQQKDKYLQKYNTLKKHDYFGFISANRQVREIIDQLDNFADSDATILIQGPTGSGKGMLASAIHLRSNRKNGPFVKVDCASLPQSLMERELFGHEKGAFTGAISQSQGKFESANKGTIFLDEIANISLEAQVKLLGFLEDHTFTRVGGTSSLKVDVRIIAATNADLPSMIRSGKFREDLYYRLRVFDIRLPSLEARRDDIPLLAEYFVRDINKRYKLHITQISRQTMEQLVTHSWPGNVRELYNTILGLAIDQKEGEITAAPVFTKFDKHVSGQRNFVPVGKRYELILDFIRQREFTSARDLIPVLGTSLPTIKRDLKALVSEKRVTRAGNGPAARYCADKT